MTYEEARKVILATVHPVGMERVMLLDAVERVLGEDIVAPWDLPPFDNSAMDGFAVRAADCSVNCSLAVSGYIPAGGTAVVEVTPGTAMRIMTGAPTPPGCDAVVPFEETEEMPGQVLLRAPVEPGQHIRRRGEDVAAGSTVLTAGTLLRPTEISMLASCGRVMVPVYRKVRVAIVSTGDELVEPGGGLIPGTIINSNSLGLAAAVKAAGAEPIMLGIARDTMESHREKIREGLLADVLITSAGVSCGDRDLVRDMLEECGVASLFWKLKVKPGGTTAFGMKGETPVFSLPGNPVSTLLTFEEYVRPALLKMMGHRRPVRPFFESYPLRRGAEEAG